MNAKNLTQWKKAIKATGADVSVIRIGSGKHQSIGLTGPQSPAVAKALVSKGLVQRTSLGCTMIILDEV